MLVVNTRRCLHHWAAQCCSPSIISLGIGAIHHTEEPYQLEGKGTFSTCDLPRGIEKKVSFSCPCFFFSLLYYCSRTFIITVIPLSTHTYINKWKCLHVFSICDISWFVYNKKSLGDYGYNMREEFKGDSTEIRTE